MAELAKRGVQGRGPVNLLWTILAAAVETGALEAMSKLLKPPPFRAPLSTEEVGQRAERRMVAAGSDRAGGVRGSAAGRGEGARGSGRGLETRRGDRASGAIRERLVRELDGHSKLHSAQRYVHAIGAHLRDAFGRLAGN